MDRQTKGLIIGGLLGALLGMVAAWLYMRAEGKREEAWSLKAVPPNRMLRLGLAVMEALHQVATLGQPEEGKRRRGRLPI